MELQSIESVGPVSTHLDEFASPFDPFFFFFFFGLYCVVSNTLGVLLDKLMLKSSVIG